MLRFVLLLILAANICPTSYGAEAEASPPASIGPFIGWLLDRNRELNGIDFRDVILATTGKRVLAFDPNSEADQRVVKGLSAALDDARKRMNAPGNAVQNAARINEVSSHVEDLLRGLLNAGTGLSCDFPRTA